MQNNNNYPQIPKLTDTKSFEKTFVEFLNRLDEHENLMFGALDFPVDDVNYLLTVGKDEIPTLGMQQLAGRAYRTATVMTRIDIHTNRLDCILRFLKGKCYKAMAMIPSEMLNNRYGFDDKIQSLRVYPVVNYLVEQLEFYEIERQKFSRLSENIGRLFWTIKHIVESKTKNNTTLTEDTSL